jgi:hypothetical protein
MWARLKKLAAFETRWHVCDSITDMSNYMYYCVQGLLLSAARTYMFSTALPLPVVAAAHAALHVAQQVLLPASHPPTQTRLAYPAACS